MAIVHLGQGVSAVSLAFEGAQGANGPRLDIVATWGVVTRGTSLDLKQARALANAIQRECTNAELVADQIATAWGL